MAHPLRGALGLSLVLLVCGLTLVPYGAAAQEAAKEPLPLVTEGRKLTTAGKLDEALARFDRALALDPKLFEAHLAKGIALDIKGEYPAARKHLDQALALSNDDTRDTVLGALAVACVFANDTAGAGRFYQQLFDRQTTGGNLAAAAGTANALGRLYLETGDAAKAAQWYQTGRETSQKLSNLPGDQVDLWTMRWHHAASRLAARRGDKETAAREAAALKALIDKNELNAKEMPIYHYLIGYNALYGNEPDAAIAALQQADQRDPFILGLLGQAYEKKGDAAAAKAAYTKVLDSTGHSLQNALMRPVVRARLARMKAA